MLFSRASALKGQRRNLIMCFVISQISLSIHSNNEVGSLLFTYYRRHKDAYYIYYLQRINCFPPALLLR
jgi:hypothetical protein